MIPVDPAPSAPPGMDEIQSGVAVARQRRRVIDRAAAVATFNAWSAAILAVLCLPFAFFSWVSLLAAIVLGANAYAEFAGRKMLRDLDLRGPVVLAANQAALALVIVVYAVWHIVLAITGEGYYAELAAQMPSLESQLGPVEDIVRSIELLVYGVLIAGTLAFQGGMAVYYLLRRRPMRAYLENTPDWAIDLLRSAS